MNRWPVCSELRGSKSDNRRHDGIVDAADYVVWRKNPGGVYTQDDYNTWRANFGQTYFTGNVAGGTTNAAVPEPATAVLVIVGILVICSRRSAAVP